MNTIKTAYPVVGFWDTRQGGRSENQDSCGFVDSPHGLLAIVCDGMGGGPAGKQASVLAVQAIAEYVCAQPKNASLTDIMKDAVERANQVILSKGQEREDLRGMGSTVVTVLFNENAAIVAHVGDSRLYQFRRGDKVFRTADHSLVADMVRSKELTEEQARLSGQSNLITRALGRNANKQIAEVSVLAYEKGDRFLLCTDGIWGALTEKDLIRKAAMTRSIAGAVDSLVLQVDEVGRKGGNTHDNLTMALFETKKDSTKKTKMNRKALYIIYALAAVCVISLFFNLTLASKNTSSRDESQAQKDLLLDNKNKEISSIQRKADSLQQELAKTKHEVEDLRQEIAHKREDSVKIPLRNVVEYRPDTTQTIDDNKQVEQNKIVEGIEEIINLLEQVKSKDTEEKKKDLIKKARAKLKKLSGEDMLNERIYNSIITMLNYPISYQVSDKGNGHINKQIQELKNINK